MFAVLELNPEVRSSAEEREKKENMHPYGWKGIHRSKYLL